MSPAVPCLQLFGLNTACDGPLSVPVPATANVSLAFVLMEYHRRRKGFGGGGGGGRPPNNLRGMPTYPLSPPPSIIHLPFPSISM